MTGALSEEDKQRNVTLLIPVSEKFDGTFQKFKNKGFDEIFEAMMK